MSHWGETCVVICDARSQPPEGTISQGGGQGWHALLAEHVGSLRKQKRLENGLDAFCFSGLDANTPPTAVAEPIPSIFPPSSTNQPFIMKFSVLLLAAAASSVAAQSSSTASARSSASSARSSVSSAASSSSSAKASSSSSASASKSSSTSKGAAPTNGAMAGGVAAVAVGVAAMMV
ncbi:hypothetical protein MY11210_005813 [Beauveria gryllotalpidicola]